MAWDDWTEQGLMLVQSGDLENAERMLRLALEASLDFAPEDYRRPASVTNLGGLLYETGRLEEAASLVRSALEHHRTHLGPRHPYVVRALANLAMIAHAQNRLDDAQHLYEASLHATDPDEFDQESLRTMISLSELYKDLNRTDEALTMIDQALLGLGDDADPMDRAMALSTRADILMATGRMEQAASPLTEMVEIARRTLGPNHVDTSYPLNDLGLVQLQLGHAEDATTTFRKVLFIRERALGANHPSVASAWNNLGAAFERLQRWHEATEAFQQAVTIWSQTLGPQSPEANAANRSLQRITAENKP
ncbi:MAG: tetratricopeptide repeat protein [Myxococcales bacterium]|nr:tetratricopeptide repeat protein [Myxococcales bacterium]